MTFLQAVLMAIFQGVTELFPVSSLGHAVILPTLLGWNFDQQSPAFLPFLVVLHVGTAAALLVYFWREWLRLFMAMLGRGESKERNLIALLIVGTLPAVFFGFVFEKWFRHLFGSALAAAWFLVVNGVPWCTHLGKPWHCGSGRQPRDRFGSRPCENGWSRGVERPWASSVPDLRSSHVPAAGWRGRHGAARLFEPDDRLEPAEIEVCIGLYLVA